MSKKKDQHHRDRLERRNRQLLVWASHLGVSDHPELKALLADPDINLGNARARLMHFRSMQLAEQREAAEADAEAAEPANADRKPKAKDQSEAKG